MTARGKRYGPVLIAALALSASVPTDIASQSNPPSSAVAADEAAMAAERRPVMASPQVVDSGLKIAGLPEKVTWLTSRPGVWGSSRAKQGGTYRSYLSEFPTTFRTVGPDSNGEGSGLFSTTPALVEMNGDSREFIPALATDWAFGADGKTVYYKLQEKAKWSDGTPVTADDYLFFLKMMRNPNIQDSYYNEYYTTQIAEVKKYGEYLISVSTPLPMDQADLLVATNLTPRPARFYGGEISKDYVSRYQWLAEPTAGPYALEAFEKGKSLTFRKVKDWWGYTYAYNRFRFNVDTVLYRVISGDDLELRQIFYAGELDQYFMIRPPVWEAESQSPAVQKGWIDLQYFYFIPSQGLSGLILNTKAPVFHDVRVRRGLYYALNMQKMIDTALKGEYARYHNIGLGHAFAGLDFDDDSIRKPDFDPSMAVELFVDAGYAFVGLDGIRRTANGDRLSFELLYSSSSQTERLTVLKDEARKSGLEIVLKLMPEGSFNAVLERNFEAWWGLMSDEAEPDYWQYFHSSNAGAPQTNNFWGYANPEMDKLLDAFRAESSLEKKAEIDKAIQRIIDRDALVVPNYYVPFTRGGSWKWIRYPAWLGMKYDDSLFEPMDASGGYGAYFGYFWIDEDIRREVIEAQKAGKAFPTRTWKLELFKTR